MTTVTMIVQNGHSSFGNGGANHPDLSEPKSFLAHLRENIETGLYATSTTNRPAYPIKADTAVVMTPQELEAEKLSRVFGDKKVATFYLHMSIAISTFILLIFIGVTGYYFYKRYVLYMRRS